MGRHADDRDGDAHPDTQTNPKDYEKSDNNDDDD